jgi:hypothetical protein
MMERLRYKIPENELGAFIWVEKMIGYGDHNLIKNFKPKGSEGEKGISIVLCDVLIDIWGAFFTYKNQFYRNGKKIEYDYRDDYKPFLGPDYRIKPRKK